MFLNKTLSSIALGCLLISVTGCKTTTSLNLTPNDNQLATFVEGQTAIKSTLPNSTVVVSSAFNKIENGSRIDVVVNVNNTSGDSLFRSSINFVDNDRFNLRHVVCMKYREIERFRQ